MLLESTLILVIKLSNSMKLSSSSIINEPLSIGKSIDETEEGMLISLTPLPAKAFHPIFLTVFGISMLFRFLHVAKAEAPIDVIFPLNTTFFTLSEIYLSFS